MYVPKNKNKTKQRQKTAATFIAGLESSNSDISKHKTSDLFSYSFDGTYTVISAPQSSD